MNKLEKTRHDRSWLSVIIKAVMLSLMIIAYSSCNKSNTELENTRALTEAEIEKQRLEKIQANWDLIEDGVHLRTGLKDDENLQLVIGACTSCHSAKLITQNRATREGWKQMFDWMYATQGLPDLGVHEPKILDYLAEHYAPEEVGRRQNLDVEAIEWYILDAGD